VTIPKEMREALGIAPGAELLLQVVEGELRVVTPRVALGRLRAARDALLRRLGAAGA
jgi:AbrB family looped-hinge helix DNA binding protein